MKDTVAIILAAGRGTRMKSDIPKVMHSILGRPMISYVVDSVKDAGIKKIITVAGYGSESLKDALKYTKIVVQKRLLGSGDAVRTAKAALGRYAGDVLVVCGDTPIIKSDTIKNLITRHKNSGASATILTARLKEAGSYGRIMRGDGYRIVKIAEEEEAVSSAEDTPEINVGTYCFKTDDLFSSLAEVKRNNKRKEFYLTDVIKILSDKGKMIDSLITKDTSEAIGINTRIDLEEASQVLKKRVMERLMLDGVTIEDTRSTTIYPGVHIGRDTVIRPNTVIESDVVIGRSCEIGPFAHLRPGVRIDDNVEIGNYVELVRTKVGSSTKVKHHTYLGDTIVGKRVNVGAGTITANFDGKRKNKTIIEDGAFIGVGAILIAPLKVASRAIVGAGCVVPKNHNVPKGATVVGVPARILKRYKRRG